jgi:GNAT superfamily N-acetyltransferase
MSDPIDSLPAPAQHFRWIPIRSLSVRHRSRVLTHLMTLEAHDRYLRFGYGATDAQIARYVDTLDFERDELFGIFNRKLELIAMAHLAYLPRTAAASHAAEFGVSVVPKARGRGLGSRLFDHAVLHARNSNVDTMIIHALTENTAMLKIAHQAGASVVRDGSDAEARLRLPPYTVASQIEALVEDRAAEFDYHLKRQARRMDSLLGMLGEVRSGIEKTRASRPE